MSDLTSRYSFFLRDIEAATVLCEDFDDSRGGGHLYFDTPSSVDGVDYDTLDACAEDADGADIAVILHSSVADSTGASGSVGTESLFNAGHLPRFEQWDRCAW